MRGTGEFYTAKYAVNLQKTEPFSIVFFGDVHQFSPHHCDDTWNKFKAQYRKRKNTYFIGMGDYTDLLSTSERWADDCANFHTSTQQTKWVWYEKMVDKFTNELEFMRGNILGLVEGNHYMQFKDRTTSTQRMCRSLDCNYLGECAALSVPVVCGKHFKRNLQIAVHHGRGSGRSAGSGFNTVEQMSRTFEGFDLYAMGDNHQRGGIPIQTLRMVETSSRPLPRIESHKILLLRTGAFLRSYIHGQSSYVVDALMPPSNLGWVEVRITPSQPRVSGDKEVSRGNALDLECIA